MYALGACRQLTRLHITRPEISKLATLALNAGIVECVRQCPLLRNVRIMGGMHVDHAHFSNDALATVAATVADDATRNCVNLSLGLVDARFLDSPFAWCASLRSLDLAVDLDHVVGATHLFFCRMAQHCPRLAGLEQLSVKMHSCMDNRKSDGDMDGVTLQLPKLAYFSYHSSPHVRPPSFALRLVTPNLTRLHVTGLSAVNSARLLESTAERLVHAELGFAHRDDVVPVSPRGLMSGAFLRCGALQSLVLNGRVHQRHELDELARSCPLMTNLSLCVVDTLSSHDLLAAMVRWRRQLAMLHVWRATPDNAAIPVEEPDNAAIPVEEPVRRVGASENELETKDGGGDESIVHTMESLARLTTTVLDDSALSRIACPRLTSVDTRGCYLAAATLCALVQHCPALACIHIVLGSGLIDAPNNRILVPNPHVSRLTLEFAATYESATATGVALFRAIGQQCPNLSFLCLVFAPPLSQLLLHLRVAATDFANLRTLAIPSARADKTAIAELALAFPTLTALQLRGTKTPTAAATYIRTALAPRCRVTEIAS